MILILVLPLDDLSFSSSSWVLCSTVHGAALFYSIPGAGPRTLVLVIFAECNLYLSRDRELASALSLEYSSVEVFLKN